MNVLAKIWNKFLYYRPILTQPLKEIKLQMSIELNINLLHWYFQQNQHLSIEKHAIYNIHRLSLGPFTCGAPGNCPCVKTALLYLTTERT